MRERSIIAKVHKRIKLGLFKEYGRLYAPKSKDHGKICGHWIAFDARGYHLSQGKTALGAIESLFQILEANELMAASEAKKGRKVMRDNLARRKDVQKELTDLTRHSIIGLLDIDWRDWARQIPEFGK